MPRKQHSYHYIYKTTCKVTERFYIGMHSTSNLEDGYLGSGTRLGHSIRKWGRENHVREILEFLPDRSSLKEREMNLVNEDLLNDPQCMNIQPGGGGGFVNEEHMKKCSLAGISRLDVLRKDPEFRKRVSESIKKIGAGKKFLTESWKDDSYREKMLEVSKKSFLGKQHSEETLEKMRGKSHQKGDGNSQYGTCWITDGKRNKKWKKEDPLPEGFRLGRI